MKILHLFQYHINEIIPRLDKVKTQGFDTIMINSMQGTKDNGTEFWKLYQPINLKIGNYQTGTKEDLIKLCSEAHERGLKIMIDCILRHVATSEYDNTKPHKLVDKELLPFILDRPQITNDYDRVQCTDYSCGMPMLDYENKEYQKIVIRYLDELLDCGCDYFRIDQGAKHYRLPQEGGTFVSEVLSRYPCYGEGIFIDNYWLDEYSKYMKVITNGRTSDKNNMVAYVYNHDDLLTFNMFDKMTPQMHIDEYRVLVQNFPNVLWYAKPFDNSYEWDEVREINT